MYETNIFMEQRTITNPRNIAIRYILGLALTFRNFSNNHNITFKIDCCDNDLCQAEVITIYITNRLRIHKLVTHLTHTNVRMLIEHLDQWRLKSYDYDYNTLREQ